MYFTSLEEETPESQKTRKNGAEVAWSGWKAGDARKLFGGVCVETEV
jgi:hypothetical protein